MDECNPLTSDSIKASLNLPYEAYASYLTALRGIKTQEAMVQRLKDEGRMQPGGMRK